MTQQIAGGEEPFSYFVKVGHVSANPVTVQLSADEKECAALAKHWEVEDVKSVSGELQIARWKRDGVRLKGKVRAEIVQACVVTLEPVDNVLEEEVNQVFLPEGSKLIRHQFDDNGEMVLDPEGDDIPETFVGDSIDVGAVVTEFLTLSIDPYPRKPDVEFEAHIESRADDDKKPSPFAVLQNLKND